jgi:hypothetical protein
VITWREVQKEVEDSRTGILGPSNPFKLSYYRPLSVKFSIKSVFVFAFNIGAKGALVLPPVFLFTFDFTIN